MVGLKYLRRLISWATGYPQPTIRQNIWFILAPNNSEYFSVPDMIPMAIIRVMSGFLLDIIATIKWGLFPLPNSTRGVC